MNKVKEFFQRNKAKLMVAVGACMSTCMAFATEGDPVAVSSVTGAMGDVLSLVGTVISQIAGQPILLFFLAAGFIPVGIKIFKQLKGAAQ